MSSDWNAACRDSAWVAGSRSSLFSGPEAFRQQPWFCRLKFPGVDEEKRRKARSGGTGCGTQWVSGSRRGKPAQCRCGQTNCSCHGAGAQRSGWSPWYPRYAGWKTVIAGCRKKFVQLEGKKAVAKKQLITSLKNRPFSSSVAQERGPAPGREM